jgi:hypothetical protein
MRLPFAGVCGTGERHPSPGHHQDTRRVSPRERPEDIKLKVLVRHLVLVFPKASIYWREIEGRYCTFVIVPFAGGSEKAIQVDLAVLRDPAVTEKELNSALDRVHLPAILQTCARYDLGPLTGMPAANTI